MKNFLIPIVVFSLISVSACRQKNLPEKVKNEFSKKFASAQSVKWDSESAKEWEAEFKIEGKKMSATFDNEGKWIDAETVISEKELPAPVINTLNKDFQGYKKGTIEIFESPDMNGFELTLKKGGSSLEVIFDKSGVVLKKTDLKEEDEKNEKSEKVKN